MPTSPVNRFVIAVLAVVALAGCDLVDIGVGLLRAERHWIVEVENRSARPATLIVAEDTVTGPGQVVGTANPSIVAPSATVVVVLGIPAGGEWALFVNPTPDRGPLMTAMDVPQNAAGRMPFKIIIHTSGTASVLVPGPAVPGWFGN